MKLIRIVTAFWRSSIEAEMEYRLNFVIATISSLTNLTGALFALSLFYRKNQSFDGWTWSQALLVIGLFTLLDGFTNTILSPNLSRIVNHVQKGTLDFILLKPMDSQLWLSARNLGLGGVPNVIFGTLLVVYAGHQAGVPPGAYLLGLVPILLSATILYSMWFVVASTTIWFTKIWNATEVLRSFLEAGKYPLSAYAPVYQFVFVFILPVAFLTTVPAQVMLGRSSAQWLIAEGLIATGLFTFSRIFWGFALRSYTSASS
jgi:ABC-2 type transport system permease protein